MVDEEILYDRDGEDAPANWETEAMRNLKNTGLCECEERCGAACRDRRTESSLRYAQASGETKKGVMTCGL